MVKDPNGIYHHCGGYLDKDGEPVFLSPTACSIDWKGKKGWTIVYFLDADEYKDVICEECGNGN